MGPLGAGKSTFLDMLAGRKDPKNVSGIVYLNGRPGDVKCVSTYVTQDDTLMGMFIFIYEKLFFIIFQLFDNYLFNIRCSYCTRKY
jgi:Fe-S cluster assembly ATPase SufC